VSGEPARVEYTRRLAERKERIEASDKRAVLFARLLAVAVVLWFGVSWRSCDKGELSRAWLWVPTGLVLAALVARSRALRARAEAERAARFYQRGLARIDGTWMEDEELDEGEPFRDDAHPYAADLDLFGKTSLFSMLSGARTPLGQTTLADWLKVPARTETVTARQEALRELAPKLDLREALAVLGTDIEEEVQEGSLLAWAERPSGKIPRGARVTTFLLGLVGGAGVALLLLGHVLPGIALLVAITWLSGPARKSVKDLGDGLAERSGELKVLSALAARLEQEQFQSPLLGELRRSLDAEGMPASKRIAQFARLVGWYESRRNLFYGVLAAPLLLPTQFALAIHVWRSKFGVAVTKWLRAVGTMEALASLAAWHYEHPAFPFPTLVPDSEGPLLEGDELGHPLIPATRRVANDVRLGGGLRLLLISGSNMSGKSTYLRTIGVNVLLALAGAPVCARRLRLSHLDLGATLRVNDSLQGGQSRFFAEITRIKQIVALAKRSPLTLGLLDEILAGTNSHDRLIGARGVVKELLEAGALAVVTTHDLALAKLAEELKPAAANVHFEDRIEDGKLIFDYRMREGVVTRTNALDLMRLVGLEV
jgi:hypothetical protein